MNISVAANPVWVRELRGRMRGPRAYLFLTGVLLFLGLVSYGLYLIAIAALQNMSGVGPPGPIIGSGLFTGLVFLALAMICGLSPALTAGAISGEREKKTFDLLMATPLSPASILLGKLLGALSYVALLLLAAIPLVSLAFVFGGITTGDMLRAFLLLLAFGVSFSVIGLFFSTLFRRAGAAVIASYLVLAVFVFGSVFAFAVLSVVYQRPAPQWVLALNPFSALASALAGQAPNQLGRFGMGAVIPTLLSLVSGGLDSTGSLTSSTPLWQYTVGLYAWLTVVLYAVSTQLVKPVRRFRLGARKWVLVAFLLLASFVAWPIIYGPFTPNRLAAALRWSQSPERPLLVNGNFELGLEPDWKLKTQRDDATESSGEAKLVAQDGRQVLQFTRTGTQHAELQLTQTISQTVPADGWLQLRAALQISSQDVALCGPQGNACPLMIKLNYEDVNGRAHEWTQGFYASGALYKEGPPTCTNCEFAQAHIQIEPGKWFTYESPNLIELIKSRAVPRAIQSVTLAAGGNSFQAQVKEIWLVVREGQPLEWEANVGFGAATPTPAVFPAHRAPVPLAPAPARIVVATVVAEPTSSPAPVESTPTAQPTSTPTATPMSK